MIQEVKKIKVYARFKPVKEIPFIIEKPETTKEYYCELRVQASTNGKITYFSIVYLDNSSALKRGGLLHVKNALVIPTKQIYYYTEE